MSSLVQQIRDGIEAQALVALGASWGVSKYRYGTDQNSEATHKNIIAMRPSSAQQVPGSTRTITLDHLFELELSTRFNKQGKESDTIQDATIMGLYEQHEKLYRLIHRRNLAVPRVLVILFLDMAAPVIDNTNGTVSIIATYTVKYRTE